MGGRSDPGGSDARLAIGLVARALLWVVYAWLLVNLALLLLAFVLRLLGANPDASFSEWVYRSVDRSMAPFRGIFEDLTLTDQSVLDTSLLFAMIVYGLIALFLRAAVVWASDWLANRRVTLDVRAAERERNEREQRERDLRERELRARSTRPPADVWERPPN